MTSPRAVDPDNPLPEASFRYRRLATFLFSIALIGLLYLAGERMPAEDLRGYARELLILLGVLWVLYFGGASADDVGRLIASVKLPFARRAPPAAEAEPSLERPA